MLSYIEDTLHLKINISTYGESSDLPLYLRNGYDLTTLSLLNIQCLLAKPKEQMNLTVLRKQANQLRHLTSLNCVLCLDDIRIYTREKMIFEGIPFIIAGKQIYMPFLGIALAENEPRQISSADKISFCAQKLLLTAIYQGWTQTTLTEAANILCLSKMSISRCFDELQSVGLDLVKSNGKTRRFMWAKTRRELWDAVAPILRNPIERQLRLGAMIDIVDYKLGGMSALCHYSMLSDSSCTVYAVTKDTAKALKLNKLPTIPSAESPIMVIQVMRYDLEYRGNEAIDPLTAILSLTSDDKNDPRVETSIEEILEEHLHD